MHGSGAVADPEEARRSGEDQSARRAQFGQAVARGGIDSGLGSGCAARGDAGSGAGARGCGRRPQIQTPAGFVTAAAARTALSGQANMDKGAYDLASEPEAHTPRTAHRL